MFDRLIHLRHDGRDLLTESEKPSLLLVVELTYPVHRPCDVQVEQTHAKCDEIPAQVIDSLLLVVRCYVLTEKVSRMDDKQMGV